MGVGLLISSYIVSAHGFSFISCVQPYPLFIVDQAVVSRGSCALLQLVVVVAEVVVVVASVVVEALEGVPQDTAVVVLHMEPLPLPMAVLVVDTAMDVSSLQPSQLPVLPCCLAGPDAASTHHVCHIHMSCYTWAARCSTGLLVILMPKGVVFSFCPAIQHCNCAPLFQLCPAMSISALSAASALHFWHFQLLHRLQVASAYKQGCVTHRPFVT